MTGMSAERAQSHAKADKFRLGFIASTAPEAQAAMKLLSLTGCKKCPNRRPGKRPIGACSAKAGAPGSITLPRPSDGSKYQRRE